MDGIILIAKTLLTNKRLLLLLLFQQFFLLVAHLIAIFSQQMFIDNIITGKNPEWYLPFILVNVGYLVILFFVIVLNAIDKFAMREEFELKRKIELFWHSICMPMSAYSKFSAGDLISRQKSSSDSAKQILMNLVPTMVLVTEIAAFIIILFYYQAFFAMISMVSIMLMFLTIMWGGKLQKDLSKRQEVAKSNMQGVTMALFNNFETIKSAGAEEDTFAKWSNAFSQSKVVSTEISTQQTWLNGISSLLKVLCNTMILIIGVWFIMEGHITPGILLACQGLLVQILEPVGSIVSITQYVVSASTTLGRRKEIMDVPESPYVAKVLDEDNMPASAKLMGEIELRDVTFGYDRDQPPLLSHFSLRIKPGESVAFVGFSGCGKSTLASLISGLYEPWEGEVLFDGVPRKDVNPAVFNNSVAVINQKIVLFEDTVANNIKMWDSSIEDFAMILAARDAQIHHVIAERAHGYNTKVAQGGSNFSGGQRQRIEIATALAKEPTILIMDEATSALDSATEAKVMDAVNALGITQIIIAHRLSTIRDCSQILVMDHGKVLQQGTHDELLKDKDGLYAKLIQYA